MAVELDLDKIEMNPQARYRKERTCRSKVTVRAHTQLNALPGPLKWSVITGSSASGSCTLIDHTPIEKPHVCGEQMSKVIELIFLC